MVLVSSMFLPQPRPNKSPATYLHFSTALAYYLFAVFGGKILSRNVFIILFDEKPLFEPSS